jgi:uncharacterized membrane protein YccC
VSEDRRKPGFREVSLTKLSDWISRQSLVHALRTTVAAVLALFLARIVGLPEPYWAVIGTMIVTQSTLVSALPISGQLIAATILGGTIGAMLTSYLGSSIVAFAVGILGLGLVCASLHFDKAAYRFAGITLAIVIFANTGTQWEVAVHRSLEISIGIIVGLAMTVLWPEHSSEAKQERIKARS